MAGHNDVPPARVEYFFGTCHGEDLVEFSDCTFDPYEFTSYTCSPAEELLIVAHREK